MTRHKCLTTLVVVLLLTACSRPVQQNETPVAVATLLRWNFQPEPFHSVTGAIYALIWCCATRSRRA